LRGVWVVLGGMGRGSWGGCPPPPGKVPKVFETGGISPNGSLPGFGLGWRLVRGARGCGARGRATNVKRRDLWRQARASRQIWQGECASASGKNRPCYERTAGPSTAPLAVKLREASLRMTLIFLGEALVRSSTSQILAGNGNVDTPWGAVSLRSG
jgi:hypothetical protein